MIVQNNKEIKMFIVIVEKRISSEIKKMGDPAKDWYVLLAAVLPFAPMVRCELQISKVGCSEFITLGRVVYNPHDGTFWAETASILHPKPDAQTVAKELSDEGNWDVATEEFALEEAKKKLREKALHKLQQMISQSSLRNIVVPMFGPRVLKGKH